MKNFVVRFEDFSLNEMAKAWPVGAYLKCPVGHKLGKKTGPGERDWATLVPHRAEGASDGYFIMQVTTSGKLWIDGILMYSNCLQNIDVHHHEKVRIHASDAASTGGEFEIFQKNKEAIENLMGKSFFMEGDEDFIMTNDGKKLKPKKAEYIVAGQNFHLTNHFKEVVLFLLPSHGQSYEEPIYKEGNTPEEKIKVGHETIMKDNGISVKLSDVEKLTEELGSSQNQIIATHLSKELSTKIEFSENDKSFIFTVWYVESNDNKKTPEYPFSFSAGPFPNKTAAEKYLKSLKEEKKALCDVSNLIVVPNTNKFKRYTLENLVAFANAHGMDVSVKGLLKIKKEKTKPTTE